MTNETANETKVPQTIMQDEELQLRIHELTEAIESICLGSIEHVVIEAAVNELKLNWEDHLDKYEENA